jgi:ABC-type multidrug transport system fused ATPase/permease subunit
MVLTSFAEVFSIGSVLPFLGALTAPERIFELPLAQPIIHRLSLTEAKEILLPLTLVFGLATLVAGAMRLLLLWANTRLSFATGADLSIDIYRRTLYQPYTVHCARNSSEVINGISVKANGVIYNIIVPTLTLMSCSVMLAAIFIALISVQPLMTLSVFGGFGFIYMTIIYLNRKRLLMNSISEARETSQVIKSIQEGLGGIRDILIDGSQKIYCKIYSDADLSLRRAQGNSLFINASPRFGLEALVMMLIAIVAYSVAQKEDGIVKAIPMLGALALGAQRLLPILQQGYGAWTQINGGQISLKDTLELLDQPLPDYINKSIIKKLSFNEKITLKQLDFRYSSQTPYIFKNLNLTIKKGSRVGFIGPTGSGKSTLLDIVMGLLEPSNGHLEVDGKHISIANRRSWQLHIAHVPQIIFLADETVEGNIAFGLPKDEIDKDKVRKAAKQAQISESIESWPKQYQTFVGERGIRLSGGQRQRIGIARALYKEADVIIFDEATNALDNETELAVMQSIDRLSKDLTVLIIAHRISTLKNCNQIVELENGNIKKVGSYQEIINAMKE